MKQSFITDAKELFPSSDVVRKYTFKAMRLGDSYALMAVIHPILSAFWNLSGERSALFQKNDCFECLSSLIKEYRDAVNASSSVIAV